MQKRARQLEARQRSADQNGSHQKSTGLKNAREKCKETKLVKKSMKILLYKKFRFKRLNDNNANLTMHYLDAAYLFSLENRIIFHHF